MSILDDNRRKSSIKTMSGRVPRARSIENFIVVWINFKNNELDQSSLNQLQQIINSIQVYSDKEQCIDYLSHVENEKIFIIIPNKFDIDFISLIEPMSQVYSIYLLSDDIINHHLHRKFKGSFNKIDLICQQLEQDIYQCQNDLTPISTFTSNPIIDVNELDQSFIYSQLNKEILLKIDYNETAKVDFLDFCRIQYADNRKELGILDEFEQNYTFSSSIWWYTRNCFTYSMLNRAFRTQDTEILIKMGFLIRDIHEKIQELHFKMNKSNSLTVFRVQTLLCYDFDKLKTNKNGYLSFNNFVIANVNQELSLNFAKQPLSDLTKTTVLFRIDLNSTASSTPFISLDDESYYSQSKGEILFSLHTIFKINDIKQIEDNLWQVDLSLTNDNDKQLLRLQEYIRKAAGEETGMHRIAKLMTIMGQIDKAKKIYLALLETTNDDDEKEIAHIHHQLAKIFEEKDDLENAFYHYDQSLQSYLNYLPSNDPQLSPTYSNIGLVLKRQDNLVGALECFQRALDIELVAPSQNPLQIAIRYNNIGGVLDVQGKHVEALENYQKALEITENKLPKVHPLIGATHNNIGLVYYALKDYSAALGHIKITLDIEEKSLPLNHPSLIMTHANIAALLEDLHQYSEAIEHVEKAARILRNTIGTNHPRVTALEDHINQLRTKS